MYEGISFTQDSWRYPHFNDQLYVNHIFIVPESHFLFVFLIAIVVT